ncbi:MAG: hypothetical protein HW421_1608 [Ignavibacteria bacterium]|nr:hypothetical protein [Ignavibacteria bacterium]
MNEKQITHIISNPDVLRFINHQIELEYNEKDIIDNILFIGVSVLERVQSSRDIEFIKKEADKIVLNFQQNLATIEKNFQDNIEKKLESKFDPDKDNSYLRRSFNYFKNNSEIIIKDLKNNIGNLVENVNKISTQKIGEIEKGIKEASNNFDPNLENSYLGKMKKVIIEVEERINDLLDETREGTFAKNLKDDTEKYFGEDSPIILEIKNIINEYTETFSKEIQELRDSITKKITQKEMIEKSTIKGTDFEEDVYLKLQEIARPIGDIVDDLSKIVGINAYSKKGDYTYKLKEGHQIVIEAKNTEMTSLRQSIEYLNKSMMNRNAIFAIYVTKSENQLQDQVGIFGFRDDNKIFTTIEYLEYAIIWTRLFLTKINQSNIEGINKDFVNEYLNQIINKIKEFTNIKTKLKKIQNTVEENIKDIQDNLDNIKTDIDNYIKQIVTELTENDENIIENSQNTINEELDEIAF